MADPALGFPTRQFETAWKLTTFHLDDLSTEECLWRPSREGPHFHRVADGKSRADWPEHERYDLGPGQHRLADLAPGLSVVDRGAAVGLVRRVEGARQPRPADRPSPRAP